jgi:hypothetical protein
LRCHLFSTTFFLMHRAYLKQTQLTYTLKTLLEI